MGLNKTRNIADSHTVAYITTIRHSNINPEHNAGQNITQDTT